MLENIPNNSMYTTIPPEVDEICFIELWEKQNGIPNEPCDFEDLDMNFLEIENAEFEDMIKNAPKEMI